MVRRAWAVSLLGAGLVVGGGPAGPAVAAEAPFEPVDSVVTGEGSGGRLDLVGVEATGEDGVDRVVYEFAGDGVPGYRVEYTDFPAQDGSGFVVDLAGETALSVFVSGTGFPPDAPDGVAPIGPGPYPGDGTAIVTEVDAGSWFEGNQASYVGMEHEVPFRVATLTDPARLVVEVEDAPNPGRVPVRVFYGTEEALQGTVCTDVTGFDRSLLAGTEDVIGGAFRHLVSGPTAEDTAAGAATLWDGRETQDSLRGTSLTDGLLVVDFSADLALNNPGASTSCASGAILAELQATAFQFEEVERVSFTLDGDCDAFFGWLQRSCTAVDRAGNEVPLDGSTSTTPPTPSTTPTPTTSGPETSTTPPVPTAVPAGEGPPPGGMDPAPALLAILFAGTVVVAGVVATRPSRER